MTIKPKNDFRFDDPVFGNARANPVAADAARTANAAPPAASGVLVNPTVVHTIPIVEGNARAEPTAARNAGAANADPSDSIMVAHASPAAVDANAGRPGGVYDQTIANYNKMIELDPNDAEAYTGRALAYLKAGYPKQGLLDIQRALVLSPTGRPHLISAATSLKRWDARKTPSPTTGWRLRSSRT